MVAGTMLLNGRHVDANHVERADLGLLDRVLLRAQRALAEHLDVVFAAGALGDQLAHVGHRLHRRIVERVDVGRAEIPGLGHGGRQESRERDQDLG
jgi:hypothetical protein